MRQVWRFLRQRFRDLRRLLMAEEKKKEKKKEETPTHPVETDTPQKYPASSGELHGN